MSRVSGALGQGDPNKDAPRGDGAATYHALTEVIIESGWLPPQQPATWSPSLAARSSTVAQVRGVKVALQPLAIADPLQLLPRLDTLPARTPSQSTSQVP